MWFLSAGAPGAVPSAWVSLQYLWVRCFKIASALVNPLPLEALLI